LRVPRLSLRQHLADVVHRPLDWQGVSFLYSLTTMTALTTWVVAVT
jgi:hypothetical protein